MSSELSMTSATFFHLWGDSFESNQNFNDDYCLTAPELKCSYKSEEIKDAFKPIIESINKYFPSLTNKKILEIGGSSGLFSQYLQDQSADVTMLEIQEKFVEKAKERGINAKVYTGLNFDDVIKGQSFDIIVANRVFEDIVMPEYKAQNLVRELYSHHLNPSGIIVIGTKQPEAVWKYNSTPSMNFKTKESFSYCHPYIKQVDIYQK